MKNSAINKIMFSFFLCCQFGFAQVDVTYNNLVWSDEFTTNGAVNSSNWFHQTQLPAGGNWFNNEVQHYTNQVSNSYVDNGYLNIVAKKELYTDQGITKEYTSARLNSKFAFKYGRVDVRAKLPLDAGTWPAIWMLGKNVNEPGGYYAATYGTTDWPACGEIDIMEHGIFPSQSSNYIQSTLHTPTSFGGSVNNGGINASDLANNYHVYSLNWSPFEMSFLLDGVVFYTYNPAVKDATTWPFDKEQYILLDIAMGGTAGTINSNYTQSSMLVDYVRVYQNTLVDTQAPTNFTASIGVVTYNSIELLLNANDNSSTIAYNITYGATTISVAGTAGVQKSVVINGLSPSTNYVFSIAAGDLSGNNGTNNPIILNATTPAIPTVNTECLGTSTVASQGTFSTGYRYGFQTTGTDVKITFELLDTDRVGVVAYLWKQSPFSEVQMTNVTGTIFTKTITGQTVGSTINYAVKFAYSGGMSVTKYFSYVVGNTCALSVHSIVDLNDFYFSNPANDFVSIYSNVAIEKVEIYNLIGNMVLKTSENTDKIDVSNLAKGIYLISAYSGTEKCTKKIIIK
jgi:beta-glucanase (GH16 family)